MLVSWSVRVSFFRHYGRFLHYCSCPNAWVSLLDHCSCPPKCIFGSCVSGLVLNADKSDWITYEYWHIIRFLVNWHENSVESFRKRKTKTERLSVEPLTKIDLLNYWLIKSFLIKPLIHVFLSTQLRASLLNFQNDFSASNHSIWPRAHFQRLRLQRFHE